MKVEESRLICEVMEGAAKAPLMEWMWGGGGEAGEGEEKAGSQVFDKQ